MADIMEILKTAGIEIPDDKKETVNTELRKAYKHVKEVDKKSEQHQTELSGLTEKLNTVTRQLETANAEIGAFKGMDIEGIKKAADEYKTKFEEAEKAAATKITELEFDKALDAKLGEIKFTSEYAKQGVRAEIKEQGLTIKDGAIMGLQDMITAIQTAKPDAFAPDKPGAVVVPGVTGGTPMNYDSITAEDFKKLGYLDRLKLKEEQPALYAQLTTPK